MFLAEYFGGSGLRGSGFLAMAAIDVREIKTAIAKAARTFFIYFIVSLFAHVLENDPFCRGKTSSLFIPITTPSGFVGQFRVKSN